LTSFFVRLSELSKLILIVGPEPKRNYREGKGRVRIRSKEEEGMIEQEGSYLEIMVDIEGEEMRGEREGEQRGGGGGHHFASTKK
jgi:hypothetical protein